MPGEAVPRCEAFCSQASTTNQLPLSFRCQPDPTISGRAVRRAAVLFRGVGAPAPSPARRPHSPAALSARVPAKRGPPPAFGRSPPSTLGFFPPLALTLGDGANNYPEVAACRKTEHLQSLLLGRARHSYGVSVVGHSITHGGVSRCPDPMAPATPLERPQKASTRQQPRSTFCWI